MELTYQLVGAGWAGARICKGDRYREMTVSYLSDGLGDMARAALHLLRGGREATFSFEDEPGRHRWVLTCGAEDALSIRIFWFDDTFSSREIEQGTEVFACDCVVLDFAGQVLVVLQHILTDDGIDGYKRRWCQHDFPTEAHTEIQRRLMSRKHDRT